MNAIIYCNTKGARSCVYGNCLNKNAVDEEEYAWEMVKSLDIRRPGEFLDLISYNGVGLIGQESVGQEL